MCGISGFFGATLSSQQSNALLHGMSDRIRHRGPDHQGVVLYPEVHGGFAHNRLSILDLNPRSNQPFECELPGRGRFSMIFNGEIYNYLEVRQGLIAQGIEFTTSSDTEVFLKAYAHRGEACLDDFNGMWACAIIDHSRRTLFLSTDRFGVKPVYYRIHESGFWFASEVKAFHAFEGSLSIRPEEDHVLLSLLTFHGMEGGGVTPYAGVERLPAGMNLLVNLSGQGSAIYSEPRRWWNTFEYVERTHGQKNRFLALDDASAQFRELFDDACKLRLRSDVDVATSLSGGLDSSSVCASVAQLLRASDSRQKYKAFSFRPHDPKQNEWKFAKLVFEAYPELIPMIIDEPIGAFEDRTSVEKMMAHHEMIYGGYVQSSYDLYANMHENGMKVCLDGHGADEYLGGYHQYPILKVVGDLAPKMQWSRMQEILKAQIGDFYSAKFCAKEFLKQKLPGKWQDISVILGNLFFLRRQGIFRGTTRDMFKVLERLLALIERRRARLNLPFEFEDPLNHLLFEDTHISVLPRILRNFDVASMKSAVEVRMPFMDYRLIAFAFSLPSHLKVDPATGYTKMILRHAMKDRLPAGIVERRLKLGFSSSAPSDEVVWGILAKHSDALAALGWQVLPTKPPKKLSYFEKGKLWRLASAAIILRAKEVA